MIAHFVGLLTCGLFVKSPAIAKSMMLGGMGVCLVATVPFFFSPTSLWLSGLIVSGYFSGCAVAAWGFFLRAFTPRNERIKSCADVLIYSKLLMIAVNVIALTVVCVTLVMLPPLNHQLVLLLKSHAYLAAYDNMSQSQQTDIVRQVKTLDPLTVREQEMLQLILSGKSNREIAGDLFISENTVKTRARSIFSKYDVSSRAELISTLLKYQIGE
jgi:DNA-binding CsgD family transcriptional regulator